MTSMRALTLASLLLTLPIAACSLNTSTEAPLVHSQPASTMVRGRPSPDSGLTFYVVEQVYGGVVGQDEVAEFHASSTGDAAPFRKLKQVCVNTVESLAVGPDGEIYVEQCSQFSGDSYLQVYAPTAHGVQPPIRSFNDDRGSGPAQGPKLDANDHLFGIPNSNSFAFGEWAANAGGGQAPMREVYNLPWSPVDEAVDTAGDNWILNGGTANGAQMLEYGPTANGNAAPIRAVQTILPYAHKIVTDSMNRPWIDYYDNARSQYCVARFSATANGNVSPQLTICPSDSVPSGSENSFDVHGGMLYMLGTSLICPVHCSYNYWIATYKQNGTFARDIYTASSGPGVSNWNTNGVIAIAVH